MTALQKRESARLVLEQFARLSRIFRLLKQTTLVLGSDAAVELIVVEVRCVFCCF
jgi:hypothetical protein